MIADRYEIVRELGRGAAGTVYEVRDTQAGGATMALKVLKGAHVADSTATERFRREAMVLLDLRHPAIVRIHDFGVLDEGVRYFTMELVEGETLRQRLGRVERIAPAELVPAVRDLGAALAWAHQNGVIHRDIKPQNIMIRDPSPDDGQPVAKLLDFGIAKVLWDAPMTADGVSLGTLRYTPPEQVRGAKDVDERSDVYSLAMVLYEAIAGLGVHPFDSNTELIGAILEGDRVPLSTRDKTVPPALSAILARALSADRVHRPKSVTDFADAFRVAAS